MAITLTGESMVRDGVAVFVEAALVELVDCWALTGVTEQPITMAAKVAKNVVDFMVLCWLGLGEMAQP